MSVEVKYSKVTNAEEAFKIVKKNMTADVIAKFKIKADMEYDETQKQIHAKGTGFHLKMNFLSDKVKIDLDVSFLLKAIRGQALSKIEKMLTSVL